MRTIRDAEEVSVPDDPIRPLPHQPALDGLRGVAVAGVLAFHQGFSWMSGGFLGVSLFFTLSGFLITLVVLADQRATGPRLRRFFARRARRLLPAAWVTVALVAVLAATGAQIGEVDRADVLATLGNVMNWRLLLGGVSYADLYATPSPLQHYWSLAIEEQFYLAFPFILVFGLRRHRLRTAVGWVVALAIAGTVWMAFLGPGDRTYYGTDTRVPEMLVGVAGALAWSAGWFDGTDLRRRLRTIGPVALVAMLALWTSATVRSTALTNGGFLFHAVAALVVVLVAMEPGMVRSGLSVRPLVALGRISYGVYLLHWPVFLWLDEDVVELRGVSLFALRCAVTLAAATVSFVLLEQPVRRSGEFDHRRRLLIAGSMCVGVVVLVALAPMGDADPSAIEEGAAIVEAGPEAISEAVADLDLADPADEPRAAPDLPPLQMLVMGDSTALFTGGGLEAFSLRHPDAYSRVDTQFWFGCALVRGGDLDYGGDGVLVEVFPECADRESVWPERVRAAPYDVVVVQLGPYDVADHHLPGSDTTVHPGDPVYDRRLEEEIRSASQMLTDLDVAVVWLTAPQIVLGPEDVPPLDSPTSEDARIDRYNEILTSVVADLAAGGDRIGVVDLEGHLSTSPGGPEDLSIRPDGVHFTIETAAVVAEDFLGPAIRRTVAELGLAG